MEDSLHNLVASIDIADRLGVSPTALANWKARDIGFPEPVLTVARNSTPLYWWPAVLAWRQRRDRETLETVREKLAEGNVICSDCGGEYNHHYLSCSIWPHNHKKES